MRLLVVSDSHRDVRGLERILEKSAAKYGPPDLLLHCGDGALDPQAAEKTLLALNPGAHWVSVRGNCDGESCAHIPWERVVQAEEARIFMAHGHGLAVKSTHLLLEETAREHGCSIALFGHTHEPFMAMASVLLLNPGAAREGCYLSLEIRGDRPRIHLDHV